jgi:ABC-type sugar transport system permease subunit
MGSAPFGYLLVGPLVLWLVITIVIPLLYAVYVGFTDAGIIGTEAEFIGLENYAGVGSPSRRSKRDEPAPRSRDLPAGGRTGAHRSGRRSLLNHAATEVDTPMSELQNVLREVLAHTRDALEPELIEVRRDFHSEPELLRTKPRR